MNKKVSTLAFLMTILIASCGPTAKTRQTSMSKHPNIIYVLADDLGYGDVAALNKDSKIATPGLDRLAAEGMLFTDAHSPSAVCTPTRYSIVTGRYNWRSTLKKGVLSGDSPALIDPERKTVATILKDAGYHTAYIGKWHLGWNWGKGADGSIDFSLPVRNNPNQNGFEYAYGFSGSLDMPPYVYVENGKSTAIPKNYTENKDYQAMWRKGLTAPDFVHEEVLPNFFNRAFDYIRKQANGEKPFFLYLPLPSPHTPILPSKEWQGKSGLNPYADFVMMTDAYIQKLEAVIKEAGIEENTLIIFTSDNGCSPRANFKELEAKGHFPSGPFRGTKADIFEGGHRVPFIAKWPRVIKPGSRCDQTICLVDFMATCAEITKTKMPDNAGEDSYSMLPLFNSPNQSGYQRTTTIHHSINGSFAIRKGAWKLILCRDSGGWSDPVPAKSKLLNLPPVQLYNLAQDPGEQHNVYADHPEIVASLKAALIKQIKDGRSTPGALQANDGGAYWPELNWMN
ncbi:arylsulfatase [Niabella insulamsoli]|uniref:sulfatase family protein n=1 Tax=Niabella insulamsoli TaxID=3144874 RepID=UPI0031FE2364